MLTIKSEKKNYAVNFPTSLKEITPEVLTQITENVRLPDHYGIVALCFGISLFEFATKLRSTNKNQENTANVVPVLVKVSEVDLTKFRGKIGDKLIIDRSSLERGNHLVIPVMISSSNAMSYVGADEKLLVQIIKGQPNDPMVKDTVIQEMIDKKNDEIYMLEFKILPMTDIKAYIGVESITLDPFKTITKSTVN